MRFLIISVFVLLLAFAAYPAVSYVPDDYPTIQEAIDSVSDGDEVVVRPGTYMEKIDFEGKAIHLRSDEGASTTFINAGFMGSGVTFQHNEGPASVLEGFTIYHGSGNPRNGYYFGGGIYVDGASPTIIDNVIAKNSSDYGGGICYFNASGELNGNTIYDNTVEFNGGGIACYMGSTPSINDNLVSDNYSTKHYFGGGILCDESNPDITGNVITCNDTGYGGGIFCYAASPIIDDNIITENMGEDAGCGIALYDYSSPSITNNIITDNSSYTYCIGFGGGIYTSGTATCPLIANNIITGNWVYSCGGGITSIYRSRPIIVNNVIAENEAGNGGGLHVDERSVPTVENTIFWDNRSAVPITEEIVLYDGLFSVPCSLSISFSVVDGGLSTVYVQEGCALEWGDGMIEADPLFVDQANHDFHIIYQSPCRDAGDGDATGLPVQDFEGDPRPSYGNPDIGVDEFFPHLYHIGDLIPGNTFDVKVAGLPGTSPVVLGLGAGILNQPEHTPYGDLYLEEPIRELAVGPVPDNGIRVYRTTVPFSWSGGETHPIQALVGDTLTNLNLLEIE